MCKEHEQRLTLPLCSRFGRSLKLGSTMLVYLIVVYSTYTYLLKLVFELFTNMNSLCSKIRWKIKVYIICRTRTYPRRGSRVAPAKHGAASVGARHSARASHTYGQASARLSEGIHCAHSWWCTPSICPTTTHLNTRLHEKIDVFVFVDFVVLTYYYYLQLRGPYPTHNRSWNSKELIEE